MSIKRLSGAGLTTPKSNKLWDQVTFQSGMFALATVRLTSATSTVVFDNIPQGYTNLHLRITARCTSAYKYDEIDLRFNSDTSNNYRWHGMYANAGNGTGGNNGGAAIGYIRLGDVSASTAGANKHGVCIATIPNYTSTTKAKTLWAVSGFDDNGTNGIDGYVNFRSGLWFKNTSSVYEAVTKISLTTTENFSENSHFALYGMKGA
jgi:hypothetical protein